MRVQTGTANWHVHTQQLAKHVVCQCSKAKWMDIPVSLLRAAANLASDVVVAAVLVIVHGAALMSQVGGQHCCIHEQVFLVLLCGLALLLCTAGDCCITGNRCANESTESSSLPAGHGVWRGDEQQEERAGGAADCRQLHGDQGWGRGPLWGDVEGAGACCCCGLLSAQSLPCSACPRLHWHVFPAPTGSPPLPPPPPQARC